MSEVFLNQLQLLNFRTFGKFALDVAPAPGLVLLVGTNGLGKSSFFDAIEWGLTGQIRRFQPYLTTSISEADYLTRRDAPPNSHEVRLRFNLGDSLIRTADRAPDPAEVIELLKKRDWGAPIQDIATYLAFTHFLGQAAQQRFTSRDRAEQWESLKGPSGIDRLEEVRQALRGRVTGNAFRRRLEKETARVEALDARLADWQTSRLRLQRLRESAGAAGVLAGAELDARIRSLATKLAALTPQGADRPTSDASDTAAVRLMGIRDGISAARTAVSARLAALERLTELPERHTSAQALANPDSAMISSARKGLQEAQSNLDAAAEALREAQAVARQQSATVTRLKGEITLLVAAREDLERLAAIEKQLSELAVETSGLETELAARHAELSQVEATLKAARIRRSQLAELEEAWTGAKASLDLCRQLAELEDKALAAKATADLAASEAAEAQARQAVMAAERDRLSALLAEADQRAKEARTRATEVAAAVARIATHLGPQDDHCPVCATAFKPEDLKLLADQASEGYSAGLASVEAVYAEASLAHDRAVQNLATITATIARGQTAAKEAEAARAAAVAMRSEVDAALGTSGEGDPNVLAAAREATAAAAVAGLQLTISAAEGGVRAAVDRRPALSNEVDDLGSRISELSEQRASLEREQRAARERLVVRGRTDAVPGALNHEIATSNRLLAQAQTAVAEADAKVRAAASSETDARERVEAGQAQLERQLAIAQAAARNAAALEAQWTAAGLEGKPMASGLDQGRSRLSARLDELEGLSREQAELAASHEAAMHHQEMSDLVRAMELEGGEGAADEPEAYEAKLSDELKEAKAAHQLSESARMGINAFADHLQGAAREFSIKFLAPLNDLIDDFNEALLSSPGESIRFNAAHHVDATRFDMRLRFRDQLDEALYNTELPPQVVLSEGQLAANGFSILCAASTAYPWSKWRALLLDDPLQHNDIIHAAAFVDVMRNLVELERYQLIVTSHDRAESEFIARKFDAANLPCTVVTLTAPSKDGVKFEPPRHNRAASAQLGACPSK